MYRDRHRKAGRCPSKIDVSGRSWSKGIERGSPCKHRRTSCNKPFQRIVINIQRHKPPSALRALLQHSSANYNRRRKLHARPVIGVIITANVRNQNDIVSTRVEGEVVHVKPVLMFQVATPQIYTTQQPHVGHRHGRDNPFGPGIGRWRCLPATINCIEGELQSSGNQQGVDEREHRHIRVLGMLKTAV